MFTLKKFLLTLGAVAPLLAVSSASAAGLCAGYPGGKCESNPNQGQLQKDVGAFNQASSTQCKGQPTITVPYGGDRTLRVNNTNVATPGGAYLIVNGNGNCVFAGSGSLAKVNGNYNYVTAKYGAIYLTGANNFFQSQGGNYVKCGGSQAIVDPNTDAWKNCQVQD